MGLMDSLKDYWNSVPASKVVPQIKNHVGNVVKTLSPSTSPEDRKVAAAQWADSVIEGMAGMGPSDIGVGGLMGYTKNGIANNHPDFVRAYRKNLHDEFAAAGKQIRSFEKHYPDYSYLDLQFFDKDGLLSGTSRRKFTPEGVKAEVLKANDPDKPMGVMPVLYPAEAKMMQEYGGDLWGQFINPITHEGFFKSNPEARWNTGQQDVLRTDYPGTKDFIPVTVK